METAFGIGMTTGPAVGGILYKYEGFYFPFVVVGGLLLSCSMISALIIDSNGNDKVEDYQYKGEAQWHIGDSAALHSATSGGTQGTPRYSLNSSGHLILDTTA